MSFVVEEVAYMEFSVRKTIRLKDYDYSQNGAYFVTICTKDKKCMLGEIVGTPNGRPFTQLSPYGNVVETAIQNIPQHYENVKCDKFVISQTIFI